MSPAPQDLMPQMLRNVALLLSGRGVAAILGVLATIVMAKTLSAAEFGAVALIHALALLMRGLLNFKPFEAIVRYGADPGTAPDAFSRLLAFTRAMDHGSAVAATLATVAVVMLFGGHAGIDRADRFLAAGYALVLLASGTGTAKGLLRLQGQFAVLGFAQAIAPAVRLCVFAISAVVAAGPAGFLAGFGLGLLAEYLLLQWLGARAARSGGYRYRAGRFAPVALGHEHPGLWRLLNAVYWQSNLDLIPKHGATLLAGGLLGSAAAGHLRLARELASLLTEPATLLRQALFPDLTRIATEPGRSRAQLLGTSTRLAAGAIAVGLIISILCAWQDERLILLAADASYLPAAPLTVLLLIGAALMLGANVYRAAGYAVDRALSLLLIGAVAQGIFLLALVLGSERFGLLAVGYGAIAAGLISLLGAAAIVAHGQRG